MPIDVWFDDPIPDPLDGAFRKAFEMIDPFHTVSDPDKMERWVVLGSSSMRTKLGRRCVRVVDDPSMDGLGRYDPSPRTKDETYPGPRMTLKPGKADVVGTVIHECWHLVELEMLHPDRGASDEALRRLSKAVSFLQSTTSYRKSRAHARRICRRSDQLLIRSKNEAIDLKEVEDYGGYASLYEYYARDDEWLARCYSQIIQTRAGRKGAWTGRTIEWHESSLPVYLSSREAKRFDRLLSKLFRSMGWGSLPRPA